MADMDKIKAMIEEKQKAQAEQGKEVPVEGVKNMPVIPVGTAPAELQSHLKSATFEDRADNFKKALTDVVSSKQPASISQEEHAKHLNDIRTKTYGSVTVSAVTTIADEMDFSFFDLNSDVPCVVDSVFKMKTVTGQGNTNLFGKYIKHDVGRHGDGDSTAATTRLPYNVTPIVSTISLSVDDLKFSAVDLMSRVKSDFQYSYREKLAELIMNGYNDTLVTPNHMVFQGLLDTTNDYIPAANQISASGLTNTELADLLARAPLKIKQKFRKKGQSFWMVNNDSLGVIYGLKTSQGVPLFFNLMKDELSDKIFGRSLYEEEIPTVGTTTKTTTLVFGDLSKYALIRPEGLDIIIDPYSKKAQGLVDIQITTYATGIIVNGESFVMITDFPIV